MSEASARIVIMPSMSDPATPGDQEGFHREIKSSGASFAFSQGDQEFRRIFCFSQRGQEIRRVFPVETRELLIS